MENILSPSILAADIMNLGRDIKEAEKAGAQWLHIDIMDGTFVPNMSFGYNVVEAIRPTTEMFFDIHLMIVNPDKYIDAFAKAGAEMITVHKEACTHLDRVISQIKGNGCKVGVALNPATPISDLEYVLDQIDMVLIMTVNPGYGGQKYIPYCDRKIRDLRKMINDRGLDVDIEVDGGVNENNVARLIECGANVFVAGSAVFRGNITDNTKAIMANF